MTNARLIEKLLLGIAVAATLGGVAIVGVQRSVNRGATGNRAWAPAGIDTLAVLVVSTQCAACADPTFTEEVTATLHAETKAGRVNFHFSGVAVNWDVGTGIRFLEALGPFSEMSAGNGWANSGMLQWVWSDTTGIPAGIPLLLLIERRFAEDRNERITIVSQRIANRFLGAESVTTWMRARRDVYAETN